MMRQKGYAAKKLHRLLARRKTSFFMRTRVYLFRFLAFIAVFFIILSLALFLFHLTSAGTGME